MSDRIEEQEQKSDPASSEDAGERQKHTIKAKLPKPLHWKKLITIIKDVAQEELNTQLKIYPVLPTSPFRHTVLDLLRWTVRYVDQTDDHDNKIVQSTANVINAGIPNKKEAVILDQVTNNKHNFLNVLMRKGFFQYMLTKYKPFVHIKPKTFLKSFEEDIKWYKHHLATTIYNTYLDWFDEERISQDFFNFLLNRGCVEIISAQQEWEPVYRLFMELLEANKPRFRKQLVESPMFFQMEKRFSCVLQNSIPFQNTIHKLQQFMETYNTKEAMGMIKKIIIDTMDTQIQNYQLQLKSRGMLDKLKGLDPDNRLACLEYCIFKLDKQIVKPLHYLQVMYDESVRVNTFSAQDHIMGVMFAANKYLLFRRADGTPGDVPSQDILPDDDKIKLFNFKIFSDALQNPNQWKTFKSEESNWVPIYSILPINYGSTLKILLKGQSKYINIGVSSERSFKSHRRLFQEDQECIFFNVFKKKIVNCAAKTPVQIYQNIYSIFMKVQEGRVEWVINDNPTYSFETALDKLLGKRMYGFVSLCRGAQFDVIDF